MRFVIAGGGTTGHLSPGLALANILRNGGHEVMFIGSARGPEGRIVPALGYAFRSVDVEGRGPGLLNVRNVKAGAKLTVATARCLSILLKYRPCVVVGTGGYASLPAALAARLRGIPLVLHEQNSVPGLANRVAGRFAKSIGVSFPGSEGLLGDGAVLVGNPVRQEILGLNRADLRPRALERFGLEMGRRTLLVFGGSQGAQSINEAVVGAYGALRNTEIQILHLTGPTKTGTTARIVEDQKLEGDRIIYRIVGYSDSMELAYACADLALCRAGASTIAELAAVGLPGVLVPLPISLDDDQRHNAEAVEAAGGGLVMLDRDLNPQSIVEVVGALINNPERLRAMSDAIKSLDRPDAAERFAELVIKAADEP